MLVLSRRKSEQIRIGSDILIKVIDVKAGQVRIGIDAPDNIPIIRTELEDAISQRQPQATEESNPEEDSQPPGKPR